MLGIMLKSEDVLGVKESRKPQCVVSTAGSVNSRG